MLDVGVDHMIDVAHRMGITSYLNSDPAIVLGGLTYGVTPLEMASAYGTLADQGVHVVPTIITKVTDASGKVLYNTPPSPPRPSRPAWPTPSPRYFSKTCSGAPGSSAQIGRPAAGKTGTATDFANAWFCGYTPDLATAVWVGYPQGNIPMTDVHGISVQGGSFPAEIWAAFMKPAECGLPREELPGAASARQVQPLLPKPLCGAAHHEHEQHEQHHQHEHNLARIDYNVANSHRRPRSRRPPP